MSRIVNTRLIFNSKLEDLEAYTGMSLKDKTDAEIDEIMYRIAIKHLDLGEIRRRREAVRQGAARLYSFEEILKDAAAKKARFQRTRKKRAKRAPARGKSRSASTASANRLK